jgi:hypothetical protein
MKKIIAKQNITLIFLIVAGAILVSCYEKFDPDSYKPPFIINGYTSVAEIGSQNIVAYWPFDGTLVESVSGESVSNSGASFTNGFKGQALNFNSTNKSYATFAAGSSITGLGSFTISFWVNPVFVDSDNNNEIDGILGLVNLSNPNGFWGNIDWFVENGSKPSSSKIVAHIANSNGETWMNVNNYSGLFSKWSNHTLTYDGASGIFRYYINGAQLATATSSWGGPITFSDSGPMVFGTVQFQTTPSIGCCGNQPWASYLTGTLDEVRIYNKALPAEDVNALVVLQGKGK